jgi:hypothetical protein
VGAGRADGRRDTGGLRCDGQFAIFTVALGDCLPESNTEQRTHCERQKRAYFQNRDGIWRIVTYGPVDYSCTDVSRDANVDFPEGLCA